MICPKCRHEETRVLDSRETNEKKEIRRRRECSKCGYRFTTFEKIEFTNFVVIKKDKSREPYNREKLEMGIWKALEKRPVTSEQVNKMLDELEEKWSGYGKEVPTVIIGEDIMSALKKVDEVAYIRFASVYKHFKDIASFQAEIEKLG